MFHYGEVKKFERCHRLFQETMEHPKKGISYVNYSVDCYPQLSKKLGFTNPLVGLPHQSNEDSLSMMEASDELIAMRFEFMDLRVKVHAMQKSNDGWILYFYTGSMYPRISDAKMVCDVVSVVESLHIKVVQTFFIHLSSTYIREEELDAEQLLIVGETIYQDKRAMEENLQHFVNRRKRNVATVVGQMKQCQKDKKVQLKLSKCPLKKECEYFSICFPQEEPLNSILHYLGWKDKYRAYEDGMRSILELDIEKVQSGQQYAQYQAAKNGVYQDEMAIRAWLEQVSYPMSFLDFEWETYAIPPYQGMKPFDVLCFQYSLDILQENRSVLHTDYLEAKDCREEFVRSLLTELPKIGSIVVYNAQGGERLRLKQFQMQFPQYKDELESIIERMIDLGEIFVNGHYYHPKMKGAFSLKAVARAFTNESYEELEISHGVEAVLAFRNMEQDEKEKQEEIVKNLIAYCSMDTKAMLEVYNHLLDCKEQMDVKK